MNTNEQTQLLDDLQTLLERQIEAARADDLFTVEKLARECAERAAATGHAKTLKYHRGDHEQRLKELHRQLECILTDKLTATEQQLRGIQQGQKLLGVYRPPNGE
jgi:hypothetical protein